VLLRARVAGWAAVTWYKGVRELTYGQRYRMMAENDGHHVMQIPSTMQQDSGEFSVVAANPHGTVKYTALVNVLPPRPGSAPAPGPAIDTDWSAHLHVVASVSGVARGQDRGTDVAAWLRPGAWTRHRHRLVSGVC